MTVTTRRVRSDADMDAAWAIREAVFVVEQHVTVEEERDGLDALDSTAHVLAEVPDVGPVGTARLLADPDHPGVVHVGRVAVLGSARGLGVGRAIMAAVEQLALAEYAVDGEVRVELSAQETAIGFYRALGYTVDAERYLDARIWHRDAAKVLRREPQPR